MAFEPFNLSGKKVLVTGGNGGIGLGMARAVAEAGASVSIWGRNAEKNASAADELRKKGGEVHTAVLDVADESAVDAAMSETAAQLGGIDAVFANAALSTYARSFMDISAEDYRRVMSVNLDGTIYTLRSAIKQMIDQGMGGSLVVVSSLGATQGMPAQQHYAATKAGIVAAMTSCAVEYARHGIRCNAILPGFVDTDMTSRHLHSERYEEKVLKRIPARRWGAPEDFGGIAVYLASDASQYQTGSAVMIDGGFSVF